MNITEVQVKVGTLVKWMNVPEHRKEINENNLKWLGENLFLKNSRDKKFPEVIKLLKKLDVKVIEA